ncbi:MAG: hypothetical protein QM743_04285 [Chitinophagaceae bacterium]
MSLFQSNIHAQGLPAVSDSLYPRCGLGHDYVSSLGVGDPTIPSSFPSSAIEYCGKFQIYYYDVAYRSGDGFADASVGATRRSTLCAVLTYVQSVFDFSNVPAGQYIRLKVDSSYTHAHHTPDKKVLGYGAPFYKTPLTPGDIVNGFVWDYLKSSTGTDPSPGSFHADLKLNFDTIITSSPRFSLDNLYGNAFLPVDFQNGLGDVQECQYDLFSTLLHLVSHGIGYWSWTDVYHGGTYSTTNFTSLDSSMRISSGSYPAASAASATLTRVYPSVPVSYTLLWADNSSAPYRIPMNYPAHIATDYRRTRVGYGDFQNVVLRGNFGEGIVSRSYSKDELRIGKDIIGLNFNSSSFSASSATAYNYYNHRPYCSKNYNPRYNYGFFEAPFYFDTVAVDFTMVNNVGSSLVINIGSDTTLHDDDGDTLRYVPESIINFMGCGQGGNNHKLLTLSNGNRTITFTPRPNFYGKVLFAVTVTDGKETGAVVLYTIDCGKGTNVNVAPGANLVLNGDFEEGSEVKIKDTAEMIKAIGGATETNFGIGIKENLHYSDCHPYGSPIAIRNSYVECPDAHTLKQTFGSIYTSFPWNIDSLSLGASYAYIKYPDAYLGKGNRYQLGAYPDLFLLGDSVRKCNNYLLEFDAIWTATPFVYPYPAVDSVYIAFTDGSHLIKTGADASYKNYTVTPVPSTIMYVSGTWAHFKVPLSYCSDTPSNVMYLRLKSFLGSGEVASILLDNVSLKQQAYSVKIGDSLLLPCITRLYAKVSSVNSCSASPTYTWKTLSGKVLATTTAIDVSPSVATKYILTYSNGCFTGSDTFEVQGRTGCPCSIPTIFGDTSVFYTISGVTAAVPAIPLYYISANVTLTANTMFKNANVLIAPNVKITVADSVQLTLDSAHLFTCPTDTFMWAGIELASGSSRSGRIAVKNNSMIEDAKMAIKATYPKTPASGDIIYSVHSVYNRNQGAIYVANYNPATTDSVYPFTIKSNVFTARDVRPATFLGYPRIWPSATQLKAQPVPTDLKPSFIVNKTYPRAKDKSGNMCYIAMEFDHVGLTRTPFSTGRLVYEVAIGGGSRDDSANLFDNHKYGIYCNRSNMTMRNNIFINMSRRWDTSSLSSSVLPDWGGIGVFARSDSNRHDRVRNIHSTTNQINRFHDCFDAIGIDAMAEVTITNSVITTSRQIGSFVPGAAYPYDKWNGSGIWISGHKNQWNWTVGNNTISNVYSGISVNMRNPNTGVAINLDNNKFYAANPDAAYNLSLYKPKEFMFLPIYVYNNIAGKANTFSASSNFMDRSFNGISINNLTTSSPVVSSNQINLWDTSITGQTDNAQYGIRMDNCYSGSILSNIIKTAKLNTNNDRVRGVWVSFNTYLKVCDNAAIKMGRAFDFSGTTPQSGTRWTLNRMDTARKGLVIGSDIGDQAPTTYLATKPPTKMGPCGNQWLGSTWSATNSQTFVENKLNATNSKLFLRSGYSTENPIYNNYTLGSSPYASSSLIFTPNPLAQNCAGFYEPPVTKSGTSGGPKGLPAMILADSLGYGDEFKPNQWMAQLALYRLGLTDSSQYDSLGIFTSFMTTASGSRFKWITDIESAFDNDDLSQVQVLLTHPAEALGRVEIDTNVVVTDYSEADAVVANYSDYFLLYLRYLQGTLTAADKDLLTALAHKCPDLDGAVVYQARGLQF